MAGVSSVVEASGRRDGVLMYFLRTFRLWLDSWEAEESDDDRIDWIRVMPFVVMHAACFGIIFVGISKVAIYVSVALFSIRMFAITAFYHRYFSHRSFKTSRAMQFIFAVLGASAVQRGPLWWASHHRWHHRNSDNKSDPHSPRNGFWNSHLGWFLNRRNFRTRQDEVGDLMKYRELVWLDRFDLIVPFLLASVCFLLGHILSVWWPETGTNGMQMLVWGFFVSTVVLSHATFTINSFAHRFGTRNFDTGDDSRNNLFLALLTFGEGWHNNHHRYPGSVRQGFCWWEIDFSFYVLKGMQVFGLVWDFNSVPKRVLRELK